MSSTARQAIAPPALIILLASLLSACAPAEPANKSPEERSTPYVEPAWMTQQAQHEEELMSFQQTCLRSAGYQFTMDDGGFITWPTGTDVEGGRSALAQCTKQFLGESYRAPLTDQQLRGLYQRELDVRECLKNEGYPVTPVGATEEAYVETEQGAWQAYEDVTKHLGTLSSLEADAEQIRINKTCPQPGLTGL